MDNISFEWDDHKNQINIKKHQISFAEAMSVFYDDYAIVFDDPDHSIEEDRFLIIGKTIKEKNMYCELLHKKKRCNPDYFRQKSYQKRKRIL